MSMSFNGMIENMSIEHLIALIVVNIIGIMLTGGIIYFVFKKNAKT